VGAQYCSRCRRALASDRGLAFFLEAVLPLILINLGFAGLEMPAGAVAGTAAILGVTLAVAYLMWLGYFLIKDGLRNGQSLGKRWRGIKVVSIEHRPCNRRQSFVRNAILIVPFAVWLEALCVLLRADGRRIGDLMAKTAVVALDHPV